MDGIFDFIQNMYRIFTENITNILKFYFKKTWVTGDMDGNAKHWNSIQHPHIIPKVKYNLNWYSHNFILS